MILRLMQSRGIAVSYTHLDVYKRQVYVYVYMEGGNQVTHVKLEHISLRVIANVIRPINIAILRDY